MPKCRRLKQNLPNGVIKVVSKDESCESSTCQNPELASSLVKNQFVPTLAQLRVKCVILLAHLYSAWLNQHRFGHFHLALAQRPCLNTMLLAGSPSQ